MKNEGKMITIVLADDDPDDRKLTQDAFAENRLANILHCVEDGEELMDYLHRRGKFEKLRGEALPGLILLDLNMPRMNGQEVLAEIVADQALCNLPVIVLTTSTDEEEIVKMYKLRCSSYIVKPVDLDQFLRVVQSLADYWFTVVVLPPAQGAEEARAVAGP